MEIKKTDEGHAVLKGGVVIAHLKGAGSKRRALLLIRGR